MKKVVNVIFLILICFTVNAQKLKSSTYLGFGLYNLEQLKINKVLVSNGLSQVKQNLIEINYGFMVCPNKIGFFGDGFIGINTGKSSLTSGGLRTGMFYRSTLKSGKSLMFGLYYRYSSYDLRVNTKQNVIGDITSLQSVNGGVLNFIGRSSAISSLVSFDINNKITVKIGYEIPINKFGWRIQSTNLQGLELESINQLYVGFTHNLKTKY